MVKCPVQGELKILICFTLQNQKISAGSMGHLARKGFSLDAKYIKVDGFNRSL